MSRSEPHSAEGLIFEGLIFEGLIFDIQRFSIHDGPGIRTLVFFKGWKLPDLLRMAGRGENGHWNAIDGKGS